MQLNSDLSEGRVLSWCNVRSQRELPSQPPQSQQGDNPPHRRTEQLPPASMRLTLSVLAAVCGAAMGQGTQEGVALADKLLKGKDGVDLSSQDTSKVIGGAQKHSLLSLITCSPPRRTRRNSPHVSTSPPHAKQLTSCMMLACYLRPPPTKCESLSRAITL